MSNQTIVINGRTYDAATGLLVDNAAVEAAPAVKTEAVEAPVLTRSPVETVKIHAPTQQKSQTLHRRSVVKQASAAPVKPVPITPETAPQKAQPIQSVQQPKLRPRPQNLNRSSDIRKFAPHPVTTQKLESKSLADIAPQPHHPTVKAAAHQAAKNDVANAPRALKTPQAIKDEAIDSALSRAVNNHAKQYKAPKRKRGGASKFMSVASASLAIILLGGYFTYLNMPNLSVRVAAATAGIDASYPEYRPDGYRLNGPIASQDDQVSMKFAANSGPQNFTLTQKKSNWDSMAVSDHVNQISETGAMTTTVDGLTIYIYGSNAAWVNGGILYSIEGDAPLSGDQIRRIATSL